jgi:hypothetical protein
MIEKQLMSFNTSHLLLSEGVTQIIKSFKDVISIRNHNKRLVHAT